jgi:catechol 2,3-dioxygenase-like lactoylglutathione lyase family enzyme
MDSEDLMSRVQLALNVSDLDAAVSFYSRVFDVAPHKLRDGYANFVVEDPPLKLVLFETAGVRGQGPAGALNHLGVEVHASQQVAAASRRLADAGLDAVDELDTTCCHALQDKVWVHDPDGVAWEVYVVKDDDPSTPTGAPASQPLLISDDGVCCA